MLARNLAYTKHGCVDMEICHVVHGWIPYTASPTDPEEFGRVLYEQAAAGMLGAVAPYVPNVARVKAAKFAEIEASRDAAVAANATALGYQWQADDRSVKLLNGAITLGAQGAPLPAVWRTADNINMPVSSLADLLAIAGAIAAQTQTAYARSWVLKAAVESATTIQQVEAITW